MKEGMQNLEEVKSNAPEGATHWHTGLRVYMKSPSNDFSYWQYWLDHIVKVTIPRGNSSCLRKEVQRMWLPFYSNIDLAELYEFPVGKSNKDGASPSVSAASILEAAQGHMADRAATYDKPAGERSMAATVAAFKAVSGVEMSETDGWLFMALLKIVRSRQGDYKADNFEDLAAYAALAGESAAKESEEL